MELKVQNNYAKSGYWKKHFLIYKSINLVQYWIWLSPLFTCIEIFFQWYLILRNRILWQHPLHKHPRIGFNWSSEEEIFFINLNFQNKKEHYDLISTFLKNTRSSFYSNNNCYKSTNESWMATLTERRRKFRRL